VKNWKKLYAGIPKSSFVVFAALALIALFGLPSKLLRSQEIVTFSSDPIPVSPFKLKRAKAKGIILAPEPGIKLIGHLFRPDIDEPQPAVIILVSGDGLQPSHLDWARLLSEWGYVALVIDSFGSRGGKDSRDTPSVGMPADAMNGARYLKSFDFVNGEKIGLIGFSMGGSRLFSILGKSGVNKSKDGMFKTGVAFYPNCSTDMALQVPLLVFGGDQDELMAFGSCKSALRDADKYGNDITFIVYSGATHFFDNPNYRKDVVSVEKKASPPMHFLNNHYDAAAHEDAKKKVMGFLKTHFDQ
jgi:dienelactone hydrolase